MTGRARQALRVFRARPVVVPAPVPDPHQAQVVLQASATLPTLQE